MNKSHPLKFFVEVKLNSIPVIEAHVHLKIKVTPHHSSDPQEFHVELKDNGNGDPDIKSNDGIYSKYLTNFQAGEGRYDIVIYIDNAEGKAYSSPNKNFGHFSRIIKGDSLRIMSMTPEETYGPARILDLTALVNIQNQAVELRWTAPGKILDSGKVASYKLFTSALSESFYTRTTQVLTEIPAIHVSGVTELLKLNFSQVQRDCFLAIAAINSNGKMAEMSNVVHVKLPQRVSQHYLSEVTKEPIFNEEVEKKSDKVLFYVLFSIIAVLMVCILSVVVILKKYR